MDSVNLYIFIHHDINGNIFYRMEEYRNELSLEDKILIEKVGLHRKIDQLKKQSAKISSIQKNDTKKEATNLGKPKHPGTIFTFFIEDMNVTSDKVFSANYLNVSISSLIYILINQKTSIKGAMEMWLNLSEKEKIEYKNLYSQKTKSYREQLLKWEEK